MLTPRQSLYIDNQYLEWEKLATRYILNGSKFTDSTHKKNYYKIIRRIRFAFGGKVEW